MVKKWRYGWKVGNYNLTSNGRNIFEISNRRRTDRLFDLLTNYNIIQNNDIVIIINRLIKNDTNK